MTNPYKMFSTNKDIEQNGVVLDYGDFKIIVARAGGSNTKYNKMLEKETKPFRKQIQAGYGDDKILNRILKKVFAKTVVIGWEGVTDKDDNVMEFNYDNCVKLFTDLPDLFIDIQEQASNMELFKSEIAEGESKNLESSLDIK